MNFKDSVRAAVGKVSPGRWIATLVGKSMAKLGINAFAAFAKYFMKILREKWSSFTAQQRSRIVAAMMKDDKTKTAVATMLAKDGISLEQAGSKLSWNSFANMFDPRKWDANTWLFTALNIAAVVGWNVLDEYLNDPVIPPADQAKAAVGLAGNGAISEGDLAKLDAAWRSAAASYLTATGYTQSKNPDDIPSLAIVMDYLAEQTNPKSGSSTVLEAEVLESSDSWIINDYSSNRDLLAGEKADHLPTEAGMISAGELINFESFSAYREDENPKFDQQLEAMSVKTMENIKADLNTVAIYCGCSEKAAARMIAAIKRLSAIESRKKGILLEFCNRFY